MSLASTYLSRKELLADKLEDKGVTGYSGSDGLTTLIEAIDGIPSGSSNIIWEDIPNSDKSRDYADISLQGDSSDRHYLPMSYDETNQRYSIKATIDEGNHYMKIIDAATGLDHISFSAEVMTDVLDSNNRFGLVVTDKTGRRSESFQWENNQIKHIGFNNSTVEDTISDATTISDLAENTWYKMRWVSDDSYYIFLLSEMDGTPLMHFMDNYTSRISGASVRMYGLYYLNFYPSATKYIRNIQVKEL